MEGFLKLHLPQWIIRLVTRLAALAPVMIVAMLYGSRESVLDQLIVYSQVFLSVALPFSILFHIKPQTYGRICQCQMEHYSRLSRRYCINTAQFKTHH